MAVPGWFRRRFGVRLTRWLWGPGDPDPQRYESRLAFGQGGEAIAVEYVASMRPPKPKAD